MFDLFLGDRQGIKGEAQDVKHRSWDLDPFLGNFRFLGYVMCMGMSAHGFTHV
jgi:hypothetical protein